MVYQSSEIRPGPNFGDQEVAEAYKLIVSPANDPQQHQDDVNAFLLVLKALPNQVAYIRSVRTIQLPRGGGAADDLATEISYTLIGTFTQPFP